MWVKVLAEWPSLTLTRFQIELLHPEKEWKVRSVFFARQYNMDIVIRWRDGVRKQVLGA